MNCRVRPIARRPAPGAGEAAPIGFRGGVSREKALAAAGHFAEDWVP
jgi:hypothetical protein